VAALVAGREEVKEKTKQGALAEPVISVEDRGVGELPDSG
jgi:hypothetical protein